MSRVLVVWCADWPVTAVGVDAGVPGVVVAEGVVAACSAAARGHGVRRGQRLRDAQRRCPDLVVRDRDTDAEGRLFEGVVTAVAALTPRVEVLRPGLCAIPARGAARFYGGEEALRVLVQDTVVELGFDCGVGIADGLFSAELAARADEGGRIVPPGGTPAFLAPYPLSVLDRPELADLLHRLGVRTLGDFADLPPGHVAGRFGADGALAHRLARGEEPRPLAATPAGTGFSVRTEFDPPAAQADQVIFAAKRLADELHAELAGAGLTCIRLAVTVRFADGHELHRLWRHDGALSTAAVAERVRWQLSGKDTADTSKTARTASLDRTSSPGRTANTATSEGMTSTGRAFGTESPNGMFSPGHMLSSGQTLNLSHTLNPDSMASTGSTFSPGHTLTPDRTASTGSTFRPDRTLSPGHKLNHDSPAGTGGTFRPDRTLSPGHKLNHDSPAGTGGTFRPDRTLSSDRTAGAGGTVGIGDVADEAVWGGVVVLEFVPDQLVPDSGRQSALWGEVTVTDRIARATDRIQAMLGHAAITRPVPVGGRGPAEQIAKVPVGDLPPPTVPGPWPGRVPAPAPAVVPPAALPAEVTDADGAPVQVSARCTLSAPPAFVTVPGRPPARVIAWTGPWPSTERWWDPARSQRLARFQILAADGAAYLLAVTGGHWHAEAIYG